MPANGQAFVFTTDYWIYLMDMLILIICLLISTQLMQSLSDKTQYLHNHHNLQVDTK